MVFCYQNCSSDREKCLKFEAEGREFAKILRSLEQFIQTVIGQKYFLVKFTYSEKATKFAKSIPYFCPMQCQSKVR
jgi:hypothetical protein